MREINGWVARESNYGYKEGDLYYFPAKPTRKDLDTLKCIYWETNQETFEEGLDKTKSSAFRFDNQTAIASIKVKLQHNLSQFKKVSCKDLEPTPVILMPQVEERQ